MRLLERKADGSIKLTGNFSNEDEKPSYAVLSHTWLAESDEVKFEEMLGGNPQHSKPGYRKIRFCCEQAAKDGLQFVWVDVCCIDKRNSQELQEAITTMYQWYRKATKCYVYLADVHVTEHEVGDSSKTQRWEAAFRKSRWFTRGWTLQELLATPSVEFFSVQGVRLGDKYSLLQCIHEITKIRREAIQGEPLENFTVKERLSWAEGRQTSRKEDEAYSLLGIFGIFMPLMYGEGDKAFGRLLNEIDKNYAEGSDTDYLLDILPTIPSASFNSMDNQHRPECLPQTRVELFDIIRRWVDAGDERDIFWLNGIAGTGKSTIARTVARLYHERSMLGGSFFFSKEGGVAGQTNKVFTTLAAQLANNIPAARRRICEAIKRNKTITKHSLRDQWDQLIVRPLSELSNSSCPTPIVLVLDALDECDSERDVRILLRLLAFTKISTKGRLRIFITSRPETSVRCGFQQIPETGRMGFILHEIAPTTVDRDLRLFYDDNFAKVREERGFDEDWPGEPVITKLVMFSCGLFIWAATACSYIRDGGQLADRRISKLINGHRLGTGPARQLDQMYTTVLEESISQDYDEDEKHEAYQRRKTILGSIVTLSRPMSANSLANLLNIRTVQVTQTLADLHTILHVPSDNSRPIRVHHPTFRDFLLDKARCRDSDFWVDEKEAHHSLAENCVKLMSKMLKSNICSLPFPGTLLEDVDSAHVHRLIPPELEYACLQWTEHRRWSGGPIKDNDSGHKFLKDHFLHWLEAVSLVGRSAAIPPMIRMYQSLLAPSKNVSQLQFVKAARRFVFSFHSIIEKAPLQVYVAGLIFLRPTNELRRHFWSQMHPCIQNVRIATALGGEVKDQYDRPNDLAWMPGGKQLASGSEVEWIRTWDVTVNAALTKFGCQTDATHFIAISPDGKMLVSGSDDTTVVIWNLKTEMPIHVLQGHIRWVNAVTFSPDSGTVASGSMDGTLRLWDSTSGEQTDVLEAFSSCVNSLAFSPDGSLIASATVDQMILLWDLRERERQICAILDGHSGPVNSVQFSLDGKRIVSGSDDTTVRLWDVDSATEIMSLRGHAKKVWSVTFLGDDKEIASGSGDRTVRMWNAHTGDLLRVLHGHSVGINAVVFSPNGRYLASSSFDDEIRLWDATTGEALGVLPAFEEAPTYRSSAVKFLGASGLYEMSRNSSSDSNVEENIVSDGHSSAVVCLLFSPDGQSVASGSQDGTIKLWTRDGVERGNLEGHSGSIKHLAFTRDSSLIASASADETVRLWDRASATALYSLQGHSGSIRLVRFSGDGQLLASCSTDKTIMIWNTATGMELSKLDGHFDTVNDFKFSPANDLIASCSADTQISICTIGSATDASRSIRAHQASINSVAFSSDGKLLLSCSVDATTKVWYMDGTLYGQFNDHTLSVNSAAFSQDSRRAVSCSEDGTIRIWDLDKFETQYVLQLGTQVRTVSFSACGKYIETDMGNLRLDSDLTESASPSSQSRHMIFASDDWIACDSKNMLWLSEEYGATSRAIFEDVAVIGHTSGAISFLTFAA